MNSPALAAQLEARTRELVQAAAQLAATSEVLRAISNSRRDSGPVLKAVAEHAARLCDADITQIFQIDGELLRVVAAHGAIPSRLRGEALRITRGSVTGRSVIDRRTIHVHDLSAELDTEFPDAKPHAGLWGHRTTLATPLLREGAPIGAIFIRRTEVRPFSEQQIALLETFANQAVIAIENVRLFKELEARNKDLAQTLEQQTATAEILRVISSSPTNLQPVMDVVAQNAARLCGATDAVIFRLDGDVLRRVAVYGTLPHRREVVPLTRDSVTGRVVVDRQTIHLHNLGAAFEAEFPDTTFRSFGVRTALGTPLLREGVPIGALLIRRIEERPFSEKQIALLQTFADQAVIAIENVRLFNETKEALERQTATAEILRVISSSPSDLQPVFDTIARNFIALCGAAFGSVFTYDGKLVHNAGGVGLQPEQDRTHRSRYPARVDDPSLVSARTILAKAPVHVADALADPHYDLERARKLGVRRILGVPMLREGEPLGALVAGWYEPGATPRQHEDLLKTFAAQAVIAIENVRLFNETKEALERQTASAGILKVISGSPTNVQPVFDAIVNSAARLFAPCNAVIRMRNGDVLERVASAGPRASIADSDELKRIGPVPFDADRSTSARAIVERRTIEVPDTEAPELGELVREIGRAAKHRSITAVPLMRAGEGIGTIILTHPQPGFKLSEKQLSLLQTFADQAVIAIENVRLFHELETRNRDLARTLEQQTATSEVLRVIAGSPTDVQPVLDTVAERAARLCNALYAGVLLRTGEILTVMAVYARGAETAAVKGDSVPIGRGSMNGRAFLEHRTIHVEDVLPLLGTEYPDSRETQSRVGFRTFLAVPMLREGSALGTICLWRSEVQPFSRDEITLVETFADQAVIAIENVRLFNETREALEQQTATAEILRVISSSQTDVQPVFDTIVRSVVRLCDGLFSALYRFDGELIHHVAQHNFTPEALEEVQRIFPARATRALGTGRAIIERAVVHIADVEVDPEHQHKGLTRAVGMRSGLFVPMLREGDPIGVIMVARAEPGPFSDNQINLLKTFADQAVIAIENATLFRELQERNAELKQSLDFQGASGDILASISASITDAKPVFDAIVRNVLRLFGTRYTAVFLLRDDQIELASLKGDPKFEKRFVKAFPQPVDEGTLTGKVLLSGKVMQLSPIIGNPEATELSVELAKTFDYNAIIIAPMIREGKVIGAIATAHREATGFDDKQVALIKAFADQAVIAIENARLFNETKEALERQTATAEILRVISSSPTNTQPVFEEIVRSAVRLFEPWSATVVMVEGEELIWRASAGPAFNPSYIEEMRKVFPIPISSRESPSARGIAERRVIEILDTEQPGEFARATRAGRSGNFRSAVFVPLVREQRGIGSIALTHPEAGMRLNDKQLALVGTFADQGVIAIENVRLFNETKEALERQTATAEILKVISSSPTDVQPVLDAVAERAARICEGRYVDIFMVDRGGLRLAAWFGELARLERNEVMPLARSTVTGRAVIDREPVHVLDLLSAPVEDFPLGRELATKFGHRTTLAVPLLRENEALGGILLRRTEVRPFSEKQIALLQTFADQAVIAIENVRLFKELQAQTEALTRSVGQLTALGEVGQAISSTLDLETVLQTIVSRAVQLTGLDGGSIYEYDERAEEFRLQAAENMEPAIVEDIRKAPTRKGDGALGRTAITREPTQVPDTLDESYRSGRKELLVRAGWRALLAVPLLREDHLLGGLLVNRKTPGPFAPEIVELLKTFATQSAMAIQNARLFREIAEKGKQLEEASQHKSQFLASMSHELRTPLNAILGFNEMILDEIYGPVAPDVRSPLEEMQASGKHLLRLINNVLDLAKIEAGRMELSLQDYSVHDAVESVRSTLRSIAAEKGLELLTAVPGDIPLAYGDPGRMSQCLLNLAGNALKFTKAGKVEIGVKLEGEQLVYRVSDTGIGIPADKIGSLFTEFKQTDATIASEYGGTGLGLSITKKFIEMHGGRIWIESELGKGSTFIFEVPLRVKTT